MAVPWWPDQCRWPPASPLLSWCPSWPWQPREWVLCDAAVLAACRVQEHPCSRPPKQPRDQGHAGRALLLQRTCHRGPSLHCAAPTVPGAGRGRGLLRRGSSKLSVRVINWLASTRDSCDVPRTRTAVRRHSLGCSPLCDTRLPRGAGGLRGCLPGPERDGEGGRRHWEQGPAPRSPAPSAFWLIGPHCPGADGGRGFSDPQTSPLLILCREAADAGAGSRGGV